MLAKKFCVFISGAMSAPNCLSPLVPDFLPGLKTRFWRVRVGVGEEGKFCRGEEKKILFEYLYFHFSFCSSLLVLSKEACNNVIRAACSSTV